MTRMIDNEAAVRRATGQQAAGEPMGRVVMRVQVQEGVVAQYEFTPDQKEEQKFLMATVLDQGWDLMEVRRDQGQDNRNPKFKGARSYCRCGDDVQDGDYIQDGTCVCGMKKEHMHCTVCGQYTQIG